MWPVAIFITKLKNEVLNVMCFTNSAKFVEVKVWYVKERSTTYIFKATFCTLVNKAKSHIYMYVFFKASECIM